MSWKEHVDGTHCGEEHLLYMKRMVAILGVILLIIFFCLFRLFFLLLFNRVAVLFSTRVFLIRNPYLILREGEVFELHFLILEFFPSYLLQIQRSFCWELGCAAGCSKGGSLWAISGLVFQWRYSLSIKGLAKEAPRLMFTYWHWAKASFHLYNVVSCRNYIIF